jgi:hypothetical protein
MPDVNKEIALKVTTDVGQTNTALKSAEERLSEAKKAMLDLALAGKQGSKEFRDLAVEAGALKGKIESVEQTVDGLGKSANKIEVFSGAVQGIAAGFAIAQGTAALFAEGNEELQESLVKVQASLALLQGTEQAVQLLRKESAAGQALLTARTAAYNLVVGASTGALKLFRIALAATGIGAAVVAIGALVANWDKLTKAVTDFISGSPMLTKVIGYISDGFTKLGRAIGVIPSESEAATKQMIADLEKQQKLLEAAGANTVAIERRLAQLRIQLAKETGEGLEEAQEELTIFEAQQFKIRADKEAEALKIRKAQYAAYLERVRMSQLEIGTAEAKGFQQIKSNAEAGLELDRQTLDARFKLQQEAREKEREKQAEYNANKLADQQAVELGIINMAKGTFQTIADVSAFFAGKDEARQRKAFEIQKAAGIANTLIDTYAAAQAAFKSASQIPIIGAVAGPIAAATAIAAGLARVAAIRNTTFSAGSASAAPQAVSSPTFPQPSQQPPAAFTPNVANPNPTNQPNPQGGQNGTTRVIVVESDIRRVTTRVDAAERFATFGN